MIETNKQDVERGTIQTVFYPGLNELWGIAAVTVVFMHINQFLPLLFHAPSMVAAGNVAELSVVLFFVLSGFS